MILVSSREPVRFQQGSRTYLIKPASVYGDAALRRAVSASGARYPSDAEMMAILKTGIAALLARPEDMAQRDAYLALVDEFMAKTLDVDGLERLAEVERIVSGGHEDYARAVSDRRFYSDVLPIEAFRLFCVGWEGEGMPEFKRAADGVPADILDGLPRGDVAIAGLEAMRLMRLSGDEEKN